MKALNFWQEITEDPGTVDEDGNMEMRNMWFCSDGISTFFGRTKASAAAYFGVPVGDFDDDIKSAAATLGRKGGQAKSERKTLAVRENAKKPRGPRNNTDQKGEKK